MFSVFVLLYGDHENLARRCVGSILSRVDPRFVADLWFILNTVSEGTDAYVRSACRDNVIPCFGLVTRHDPPKYPLMRRAFHYSHVPLSSALMWFDDDSHLTFTEEGWWGQVLDTLKQPRVAVVGKPYVIAPQGRQLEAIRAQPWFRGVDPLANGRLPFVTGGWWAGRRTVISQLDYPPLELRHNGGDVLLGQKLRQSGWEYHPFATGVAINDAERRGKNERPLWFDYEPGQVPDFTHHAFGLSYESLNAAALSRIHEVALTGFGREV